MAFFVGACVGDSSAPVDASTDNTVTDTSVSDVSTDASSDADAAATGPINGTLIAIDGTPLVNTKVEINGQVTKPDA